jgi:hypothetical protein
MKCWIQRLGLVAAIAQVLTCHLGCFNALAEPPTSSAQLPLFDQTTSPKNSQPAKKRRKYKPPAKSTVTKTRGHWTSKGVRTTCPKTPLQLTAIVPHDEESTPTELEPENKTTLVWGWTNSQRPVLWVYVPYNATQAKSAYLQLDNDRSSRIARSPLTLPQKPGIVAISFPAGVSLEAGQLYNWIVRVECSRTGIDEVSGWIQYSPAEDKFSQQLATAKPLQQASLYAQNSYWYDAITTLATILKKDRKNSQAQQLWQSLLEDEELGAFVNQPLLE